MITFSKIRNANGSTRQYIEVSKDGKPFGSLWTYKESRTDQHPWQARTLNDQHKVFWNTSDKKRALEAAKNWIFRQ